MHSPPPRLESRPKFLMLKAYCKNLSSPHLPLDAKPCQQKKISFKQIFRKNDTSILREDCCPTQQTRRCIVRLCTIHWFNTCRQFFSDGGSTKQGIRRFKMRQQQDECIQSLSSAWGIKLYIIRTHYRH